MNRYSPDPLDGELWVRFQDASDRVLALHELVGYKDREETITNQLTRLLQLVIGDCLVLSAEKAIQREESHLKLRFHLSVMRI